MVGQVDCLYFAWYQTTPTFIFSGLSTLAYRYFVVSPICLESVVWYILWWRPANASYLEKLAGRYCKSLGVGVFIQILLTVGISYVFSVSSDTTYALESCQQIHHLLEICRDKSSSNNNAIKTIKQLIAIGSLSKARKVAYECLYLIRRGYDNDGKISNVNNNIDVRQCCSSEDIVIQTYKSSSDAFYNNENYLDLIKYDYQQDYDDIVDDCLSSSDCWNGDELKKTNSVSFGVMEEKDHNSPGSEAIERWNDCCSYFRSCNTDKESSCIDKGNDNRYLCCELAEGLGNHLILPALREPTINIRVNKYKEDKSEVISIEQEGSLRQFDVSGVLWPAGYLLGLCLSNPIECGMPEILDAIDGNRRPFAVELGCGVGFPSIAFAKFVQQYMNSTEVCDDNSTVSPIIVSTDTSNISLALTKTNAHANNVGELVLINYANHSDLESLATLRQRVTIGEERTKFDIILGSSLQSLFDETSKQSATLWQSLDTLLSNNKDAVVVLSHVRSGNEQIVLPPESERIFKIIRRVSGDKFGMYTRDGSSSDFELILLRRRS